MALMPDPDILLLDEATSGVNPTLIETIKDRIRTLNAQGKTFLLIEHNINFIADLCSRVYVLNYGEKTGRRHAPGNPAERSGDRCLLWSVKPVAGRLLLKL